MRFAVVKEYAGKPCNLLAMCRRDGGDDVIHNYHYHFLVTGFVTTRGRFIPNELGDWVVTDPRWVELSIYRKMGPVLYGERNTDPISKLSNRHGELLFTVSDNGEVICGDHPQSEQQLFDDLRKEPKIVGHIQ